MDTDRRDFLKLTAGSLTFALAADGAWAQTAKAEVHWLGQATTKITTLTGKVIVIDPFLTNNPKTPPQYKNLDTLGKVDVVLVTHGHGDHTGDVAELAKRTGATVLGPAGLIATMIDLGWVTTEKGVRFGKGGRVNPLGPQITITQVRAEHSSEVTVTDPTTKKSTTYPGGEPCGFIVEVENGFKIYHMGDTGLFGDMRLIGDYYKPDLIMIPIGGHFVMDPRDAAYATKEMLKPKFAIPFHYGTFPVLRGTPQEYQAALGQTSTDLSDQPGGQADVLICGGSAGQVGLELADAAREIHEHLLRQLGHLPQELPEIHATDHEHAQIRLGLHGGRARLAVEQAHLTEELARAETVALVHRQGHQRRAVDDDEELVPGLALTREDRPFRDLDDLRDVGDGAKLAQAAGLEDGHTLEIPDLLLTGGPEALEVSDQSHDVLVSLDA